MKNLNFGGNIAHQGDNYGTAFYGPNYNFGVITPVAPQDLYRKEPMLNIVFKTILALVSLLADVLTIISIIHSAFGWNNDIGVMVVFDLLLRGTHREKVLFWLVFIGVGLLTVLSVWLAASAYSLLVKRRYGNARREGWCVFKIKPNRCPECGARLKFVYDDGDYLKCSKNSREHKWLVIS